MVHGLLGRSQREKSVTPSDDTVRLNINNKEQEESQNKGGREGDEQNVYKPVFPEWP